MTYSSGLGASGAIARWHNQLFAVTAAHAISEGYNRIDIWFPNKDDINGIRFQIPNPLIDFAIANITDLTLPNITRFKQFKRLPLPNNDYAVVSREQLKDEPLPIAKATPIRRTKNGVWLRSDRSIESGESGAPVVNSQGDILGVVYGTHIIKWKFLYIDIINF